MDEGMYTNGQRSVQDLFDSRPMADRIEDLLVSDHLTDADLSFIGDRDMFFLATVDDRGRPSCSYKGGAPGFVRRLDSRTLAFPLYDGNGMWISAGNLADCKWMCMLFIAFDKPMRLRVTGTATFSRDDELLAEYPEALGIVRVDVLEKYIQCPRYIHKLEHVKPSPHVPNPTELTPVAEWKMLEVVQDVLPEHDRMEIERRRRAGLPLPEADGAPESLEASRRIRSASQHD